SRGDPAARRRQGSHGAPAHASLPPRRRGGGLPGPSRARVDQGRRHSLTARSETFAMPHATLNGARLHYEVYGQGDPVLLISGLGGAAVGWLLQVKDLSARYQVITLDNRGVGESEIPDLPAYPTALLADDATALLDHLGVARAHVVGASMGGTIAMELAIRN